MKADWLISDSEGLLLETVTDGDLSQFQPTDQDEILVIVPAAEVLLTEAALPSLSPYRLRQALPYALEEQVLDELEHLHFAPGPYQTAQGSLPVAIIKKTRLEQWLDHLQHYGIRPDKLIPAVFTLPYQENQWQLLIRNGSATVRTGFYTGFSSELQNVETLLALKQQEEKQAPEKLIIYDDINQSPFAFSSLTIPTDKITLTREQTFALAASALHQGTFLNLLQGAYASKRKLRIPEKNKRAWRFAFYAFSFWLGLLFLSKLGSWLILSFEHHHLQNSITKTYQAYYPQATLMLDPQTKLASKLKKELAQSEKNRLFQWLGYLAKTASSIHIQSLNYQNNQLNLEVTASSFATLDDFILSLKAQGIEVKQQNTIMASNQVKAVLSIEGKST